MTQNKKFKKVVRARMAETGESYTAARRAIERQRERGDALGIVDNAELWAASGGDEKTRLAVQADMQTYERVKQLCREMHDRHKLSSRIHTDDPAYREIVEMGLEVVPALLRRLADFQRGGGSYDELAIWEPIMALHEITGQDFRASEGVEEEGGFIKMNLPTLVENWLKWGREHGHEWGGAA
jgi:hypothetical protein